MKGKSLVLNILIGAVTVLGALSGLFSAGITAWIGAITFALTLVLSTIFPSGTLPTGWTAVSWVINIGGILLQLVNYFGAHSLVPAQDVTYVVISLNAVIQLFIKDYGSGSTLSGPTPVATK